VSIFFRSLIAVTMPAEEMSDEEIREYLADQQIPQFIDLFVQTLLTKRPDDWRTAMLEMLDRMDRAGNKGAKGSLKAAMLEGASTDNAPEYCLRDPKIQPTEQQIKTKGVTTNPTTRLEFKMPQQMRDIHTTIAARFNFVANNCQAQCKLIQQDCIKNGKPFFDEKFWFGSRNTMYPKGTPPDCTVTEPTMAMRAPELYPGAPLFAPNINYNDIVQGALGDCFFIGAVSALACSSAQALKPIQRLFVFSDLKWGIYGMVLYKNGGWAWIIIDDFIAVQRDEKGNTWPQYASPGTTPELWPMLLEKAYAKLHFSWDSIDGGFARQALEDLTGGNASTLDLAKKDKQVYGTSPTKFQAMVDDPLVLLSCSVGWNVKTSGGVGRSGEQGTINGLFKGHAYSVVGMHTCRDGQAFVHVRNPWGNDAEWSGAYGDHSPEWDKHPQYNEEVKPEIKDDGTFWMKWEDFAAIVTDIDVVTFFKYDQVVYNYYGAATETDLEPKNVYVIKVDKPFLGMISLGQEDPLTKKVHQVQKADDLKPILLSIFKLTKLPEGFDQLEGCFGAKVNTDPGTLRQVSKEMQFEAGHYAIVPRFKDAVGVGYYIKFVVPPDAEMSMWRWEDGPQTAVDPAMCKANAAQVPEGSISATTAGATGSGCAEIQAASNSGGLPEAIIQAWGIPTQTKFEQLVGTAFTGADKQKKGSLNQEQTKVAFKYFIAKQPRANQLFQDAVAATGKTTFTPDDFRRMVDSTLTALCGLDRGRSDQRGHTT
jgi:hypothetical protein